MAEVAVRKVSHFSYCEIMLSIWNFRNLIYLFVCLVAEKIEGEKLKSEFVVLHSLLLIFYGSASYSKATLFSFLLRK
jgi:hypothetical protein